MAEDKSSTDEHFDELMLNPEFKKEFNKLPKFTLSNKSGHWFISFLQPFPDPIICEDWDKIKDKSFDQLLDDSCPLCEEQIKKITELTKDIVVDDKEDLG